MVALAIAIALAGVPSACAYEWQNSDIWEAWRADDAFGASAFRFSAGRAWLMHALPGSNFPARNYVIDSAGDRKQSIIEAPYLGTLHDVFDVNLFSNITTFTSASPSKTSIANAVALTGAVLFWDADGASTSATGGTGNWLGSSTWRLTTATGTLQAWDGGNTANFGGTAGTVTVNGAVSATNLVFTAGGYTIAGANGITLASTGTAAGSQAIQTTSTGTTMISAPIILGAAAGATQTFSVQSGSTVSISSNITEANAGIKVSKTAAGTVTLSGTNSYTGTTAVSGGTLLVNGDQTAATGTTTLSSNGTTLGGTGTIGSAVSLGTGTQITGGTNGTVGSLTLKSTVTFNGTSAYLVDLSGSTSDLLAITSTLSLNSTTDQITFNGTADGSTTYTLATYSGVNGTFNTVNNLPANYQLVYGTTELNLEPIPEPSTWIDAALALGAIGLIARKRFVKS